MSCLHRTRMENCNLIWEWIGSIVYPLLQVEMAIPHNTKSEQNFAGGGLGSITRKYYYCNATAPSKCKYILRDLVATTLQFQGQRVVVAATAVTY